jgi:hypothetical protein
MNKEIELSGLKNLNINVDSSDINSSKKPPRYDDLSNIKN